ncbi:hypothetical protein ES703_47289 [subsurface metagenome]
MLFHGLLDLGLEHLFRHTPFFLTYCQRFSIGKLNVLQPFFSTNVGDNKAIIP